jgi:hypothetical protein
MQCMHCEYMDTSPILAYTALALHMTLQNVSINSKYCGTKNNRTDPSRSHMEASISICLFFKILVLNTEKFVVVDGLSTPNFCFS